MQRTGWFIELLGEAADLERLAEAFGEPPVTIRKEGEAYRLRDELLAEREDAESVRTALYLTLMRINSVARVQLGDAHTDVRPGSLGSMNEAGEVTWKSTANVAGRSSVSAQLTVDGAGGQVIPPPPSPLPSWLELASTDKNVAGALYFLQRSAPDWSELYKVFEIIRDDVGNNIHARGWASANELTVFTRTANHPDAAGAGARHARHNAKPPRKPMSLEDARMLIRLVVQHWLDSKLGP